MRRWEADLGRSLRFGKDGCEFGNLFIACCGGKRRCVRVIGCHAEWRTSLRGYSGSVTGGSGSLRSGAAEARGTSPPNVYLRRTSHD